MLEVGSYIGFLFYGFFFFVGVSFFDFGVGDSVVGSKYLDFFVIFNDFNNLRF